MEMVMCGCCNISTAMIRIKMDSMYLHKKLNHTRLKFYRDMYKDRLQLFAFKTLLYTLKNTIIHVSHAAKTDWS